jgi:hypothetical protein
MKAKLLQAIMIFSLFGLALDSNCQENKENQKLITPFYGIITGSNYSWYKNSIGKYNLNNLEFFLGYSNKFKIKNSFEVNISFLGGLKKGETYNQRLLNTNIDNLEYVYFEVDKFDRLLSHNYYFIELPITFEYNIYKNIDLTVGYSIRYYLPQENQENYSYIFDNKLENGILGGISINLSRGFFLNGNFIFATKSSYSSIIITPSHEYDSTLKKRAFQLTLQYFFN